MKRLLLTCIACAALATTASAGGMNLAWNDCGAFGQSNETFACNTNSGFHTLIASFVPPADMSLFGTDLTIFLSTSQPALSPWWNMTTTTGCRPTAFSTNSIFTSGPFNCVDPWNGSAAGGQLYTYQYLGDLQTARIRANNAVPGSVPVLAGTEYYDMNLLIGNQKTVGGACAGCADGICIVLQTMTLAGPSGNPLYVLTSPVVSQFVTFQSSAPSCPAATPTRSSTWGQLKSLYR